MKNKSKLLIAVILMIITLASISFAAFFISKNQVNDNKVLSGCFDTSFTENSASIRMDKALPLTNEQGLNTTPYSFTISNTCSINADYTVLINIKENSFSENYISYNYSGNEVNTLNTAQINNNVPSGFAKSYILGSGTLKRGKSEIINIKLWLNELADYQNMTNKTFEAEIQIVSTVSTNQTYGDVTLAYTKDGEPTNETPTELENNNYILSSVTCTEGSVTIVNDENNQKSLHLTLLPAVCTVNYENKTKATLSLAGYTQLEYLESTGTQYIDINLIDNVPYHVTGTVWFNQITTGSDYIYGAYKYINGHAQSGIGVMPDKWLLLCHTVMYVHNMTIPLETWISFDANTNPSNYFLKNDGVNLELSKYANTSGYSGVSHYLFARNENGTAAQYLKGRLKSLYVYDVSNNNAISTLIPAKCTNESGCSDGNGGIVANSTLGMYDVVRNRFFTNSGSGTFEEGPEVQ